MEALGHHSARVVGGPYIWAMPELHADSIGVGQVSQSKCVLSYKKCHES